MSNIGDEDDFEEVLSEAHKNEYYEEDKVGNMEDLRIIRRSTILRTNYGWEIVCYDDVTSITYFEIGEHGRENQQTFDISEGDDLVIFREAIRLRKMT